METIQLKTGLVVGNLCSPHPFTFDTGEVLPPCDATTVEELTASYNEYKRNKGKYSVVKRQYTLSREQRDKIRLILDICILDIILVSKVMYNAIGNSGIDLEKFVIPITVDRHNRFISSCDFGKM